MDSAGNIYVADTLNNAVRLLLPLPVVNANGVVDAAAYRTSVAAGGIASVFGTSLASAAADASAVPLPSTLNFANLMVGGISTPLFFVSPTQVNFQVPWELAGQALASVIMRTPSGSSVAQTVNLASASPGIFTVNSSGRGQGVVTISSTGQLAASATPAQRGQYVTIYCSGLGPVSNPPVTGAASAASPPSSTLATATVTIGGVAASVNFAGLVPDLVGLYQVNALVPDAVTPGSAVSLVVSINGASSNTVTIAVQ